MPRRRDVDAERMTEAALWPPISEDYLNRLETRAHNARDLEVVDISPKILLSLVYMGRYYLGHVEWTGTREEEIKRAGDNGVASGMAIAAGIITSVWGDHVQVTEILHAGGIETEEKLRSFGVDDYDIDLLKPVLEEIASHACRTADRAKS
jgi:hypothetical protein